MKKIAIVTGASAGLGKEFARLIKDRDVKEIWAVARNIEKLNALKAELGEKIIPISLDLSKPESIDAISERLKAEKPSVSYLVNNAGIGKAGRYSEFSDKEIESTITLNCGSVARLCSAVLPYMESGAHILNLSSQSSFQPVAYLGLYAATKAFCTSYSRSLNMELKDSGITVTAVCPGWVDTDLLNYEINGNAVKFPGIVKASAVAERAMRDADKGMDMSVFSAYVRFMQFYAKFFPHKWVMKAWVASIRKYQ